MKKVILLISFSICLPLYASEPLVGVTQTELDYSKDFVQLERYQQTKLYDYVRLLKARYILTKELVWLSEKIVDAIYLQSRMIQIRKK